jgi:hypothetical protein
MLLPFALEQGADFREIAASSGLAARRGNSTMTGKTSRINWLNVSTVVSAAILIGAEVFGAAFALSWAIATLFALDQIFRYTLDVVLFGCGLAVMASFMRSASRVEPFTARE